MFNNINTYDGRARSQNGEDGIIKEIFFRIGVVERYAVEFGVESGAECNSAYWLLDYGWNGLLIEGDAAFAAAARERYAGRPVTIHEDYVNTDNIVGIFRQHHVPVSPDLLSIDIDGNDYWLWLALAEYRPRIVVIEFNGTMPATRRWVMKYNPDHRWGGNTYFGASLASLANLGRDLGYALLGTDRNGVNAFFIRRDLLELSRFPEVTPEQGFHPLFIVHPHADGPFVEL